MEDFSLLSEDTTTVNSLDYLSNMVADAGSAAAADGASADASNLLNEKLMRAFSESQNPNVSSIAKSIQEILERRQWLAQVCGSPRSVAAAVSAVAAAGGGGAGEEQDDGEIDWDHLAQLFGFWGSGVACSSLGGVGLVGNVLSFLTLATMKKRSLFNNLLLTLTLFDIVFIINGGLFFVQRAFKFHSYLYTFLFPKVIYPLAGIAMTGSTYTCMAIALERFLGICHAQSDFLMRKSRYYICAILVIAVVIDCPRFFEIEQNVDAKGNVNFGYSEMRKNQNYVYFYTLCFRLVFTAAGPFLLMLFFNAKILMYYRRNSLHSGSAAGTGSGGGEAGASGGGNSGASGSGGGGGGAGGASGSSSIRRLQQQISVVSTAPSTGSGSGGGGSGSGGGGSSSKFAQERVLYLTFFCLTATFLVCHGPRVALNVLELKMNERRRLCADHQKKFREPAWMLIALALEKVLLVANSSVNFVYYCLVGKTFRQHMCRALCPALCARWVHRVSGVDLLAGATTTAGTGETTMGATGAGGDVESSVAGMGGYTSSSGNKRRRSHRVLSCDLVSFGDELGGKGFMAESIIKEHDSNGENGEEKAAQEEQKEREEAEAAAAAATANSTTKEASGGGNRRVVKVMLEASGKVLASTTTTTADAERGNGEEVHVSEGLRGSYYDLNLRLTVAATAEAEVTTTTTTTAANAEATTTTTVSEAAGAAAAATTAAATQATTADASEDVNIAEELVASTDQRRRSSQLTATGAGGATSPSAASFCSLGPDCPGRCSCSCCSPGCSDDDTDASESGEDDDEEDSEGDVSGEEEQGAHEAAGLEAEKEEEEDVSESESTGSKIRRKLSQAFNYLSPTGGAPGSSPSSPGDSAPVFV